MRDELTMKYFLQHKQIKLEKAALGPFPSTPSGLLEEHVHLAIS